MTKAHKVVPLSLDNDILIKKAASLISNIGKKDQTYFFASVEDIKNESTPGCVFCLMSDDRSLVALCDWSWSLKDNERVSFLLWVEPGFWNHSQLKFFVRECFSKIKQQAKARGLNSIELRSRVTELKDHRKFFESLGFKWDVTSYLIEIDFSKIKSQSTPKYDIKLFDKSQIDAWKKIIRAIHPGMKDSYFSKELELMRKDDALILAYQDNEVVGLMSCVINHKENKFYNFHDSWIQEFIALKNKKSLQLELLDFAKEHIKKHKIDKFKWAVFSEKDLNHYKDLGFTVFQKRLYYKGCIVR